MPLGTDIGLFCTKGSGTGQCCVSSKILSSIAHLYRKWHLKRLLDEGHFEDHYSLNIVVNTRGVNKYSDFGPIDGYISETVQDRR